MRWPARPLLELARLSRRSSSPGPDPPPFVGQVSRRSAVHPVRSVAFRHGNGRLGSVPFLHRAVAPGTFRCRSVFPALRREAVADRVRRPPERRGA